MGQVEGYERIVNGKVVKVNAYANKSTTTTSAATNARKTPGRPRISASPGSFSSGRDIPGQKAIRRLEPEIPRPEQKGIENEDPRDRPRG